MRLQIIIWDKNPEDGNNDGFPLTVDSYSEENNQMHFSLKNENNTATQDYKVSSETNITQII